MPWKPNFVVFFFVFVSHRTLSLLFPDWEQRKWVTKVGFVTVFLKCFFFSLSLYQLIITRSSRQLHISTPVIILLEYKTVRSSSGPENQHHFESDLQYYDYLFAKYFCFQNNCCCSFWTSIQGRKIFFHLGEGEHKREDQICLNNSSVLFGSLSLWKLHLVSSTSGKSNPDISAPECVWPSCK